MERNDIIEGNKLIAEFMGATPIRGEYDMYQVIEDIKDGVNEKHFFIPSEMEFNSSWNWLMPVVEKIEEMGFWFELRTHKTGNRAVIGDYNYDTKPISNVFKTSKIESVFMCVVCFIKWYNENKNK